MKKFTTFFILLLTLSYTAFAQKGSQAIDSLVIKISNTSFCSYNECTTLEATVVSGNPPYTFFWNTFEKMSVIKVCPKADSVVSVEVTDREGLRKKATVTLKASPRPDVILTTPTQTACPTYCATLEAEGAENYTWSYNGITKSGTPVKICLDTTAVICLIGITKGCADTVFHQMNVLPKVKVAISGKMVIAKGESTKLTAVISSPVKIVNFYWKPGDSTSQSITVSPDQTTTYTVVAGDANGCLSSVSATVTVTTNPGIKENQLAAGSFEVYPHPVTDIATILFVREQKNAQLRVLDVLGNEVRSIPFTGKEVQLEKGNLKAGIYFIRVYNGNEIIRSQKLVIR